MKTEITITVRKYCVKIRDERTGDTMGDTIVLDKARLQAAALVGMSDRDLIYRIYNRQGFRVYEIGDPVKRDITVDLDQLYWNQIGAEVEQEYLAMQEKADTDTSKQEADT